MAHGDQRPRARELGVVHGAFTPGPFNAITDVAGVRVGQVTIIHGEGKLVRGVGPARTGVTAVLPSGGNVFEERVVGSGFVLNGAGEVSGLTQVVEWGLIETPILLTNTLSVGACSAGVVDYMVDTYPQIGNVADVIIPVVGECDDSWLNDSAGHHVTASHVADAIRGATSGPVAEGNVGGGTGMMTCGFAGGIGTASREIPHQAGGYTIGVLVMSNFGLMEDLRIDGIRVGEQLMGEFAHLQSRRTSYGSIIGVLATDAPLQSHQLARLAKRVALGFGRMGSYAAHTSGEIAIAFSTANIVPRDSRERVYRMDVLLDVYVDPLYQAAIEATEEAILNAMCRGDEMTGADDHFAPALPLDRVLTMVHAHRAADEESGPS